jgi:hypothetical protein
MEKVKPPMAKEPKKEMARKDKEMKGKEKAKEWPKKK